MRVLCKFTLIDRLDANGVAVEDADGNTDWIGIRLDFEGGTHEDVLCIDDDGTDDEMLVKHAARNVVQSDDCEVSDEDAGIFEWFMGYAEVDPDDATTEIELPGPEISGELGSDGGIEVGGDNTDDIDVRATNKVIKKTKPSRKGLGPGCKHPTEVSGWAAGRVLSVQKSHRSRGWGRCFYQVTCQDDGSYILTQFKGNRTDIQVGDHWANVSEMFRALMGDDRIKTDGRRTQHAGSWQQGHRMTIKRWFGLGRKK